MISVVIPQVSRSQLFRMFFVTNQILFFFDFENVVRFNEEQFWYLLGIFDFYQAFCRY